MHTFDLSPLFRSAIGFERLPHLMEAAAQASEAAVGHVPYNIETRDQDSYRITLAVAGFGAEDLEVEVRDNVLVVSGKPADEQENRTYLHRGIPDRRFRETFQLADYVKPTAAHLANGLLHIDLVREVPEEMRPRQIPIGSGAATRSRPKAKVIDSKKAA